MDDLGGLSNDELLLRLKAACARERECLVDVLALILEADNRNATRGTGYDSLFDYCVRELGYSEDEAYRRIHVARTTRRVPALWGPLRDGSMSLAVASKIAPHLSHENAAHLISQARNKTWREVESLMAPRVEEKKHDRVKAVLRTAPIETASPQPTLWEPPAAAQPLPATPIRYQFSFEASPELKAALDRVKDLLAHKYPFGQLEHVLLEVALDWLAKRDPLRREPAAPKAVPQKNGRVARWVRDAVWRRDGGRCAFRSKEGMRCRATRGLELDHVTPKALGGTNDPQNLRLLCRSHNQFERERLLSGGKN